LQQLRKLVSERHQSASDKNGSGSGSGSPLSTGRRRRPRLHASTPQDSQQGQPPLSPKRRSQLTSDTEANHHRANNNGTRNIPSTGITSGGQYGSRDRDDEDYDEDSQSNDSDEDNNYYERRHQQQQHQQQQKQAPQSSKTLNLHTTNPTQNTNTYDKSKGRIDNSNSSNNANVKRLAPPNAPNDTHPRSSSKPSIANVPNRLNSKSTENVPATKKQSTIPKLVSYQYL